MNLITESQVIELAKSLECYYAADEGSRCVAFRQLLRRLNAMKDAGQLEELAKILRHAAGETLDYASARSLTRLYRSLPPSTRLGTKVKLAILGGFTTHQLRDLIELYLFAMGVSVEIYEADYGVFRQEILDPSSELYRFEPNLVFLATHWRNLSRLPQLSDSADRVGQLLEEEYAEWWSLWEIAHGQFGCQVVQNSFDLPPWRPLSNHEMRHPAALTRFIADMNRLFAERAPSYVTLHDVQALAAKVGHQEWGDQRFFLHARLPCGPECLADYAHSVSTVVAAQLGLSRKCLVLDLDNTLWGGVVGDDGIGGIRLGQGDAEGEAFVYFQHYAKALKTRGVILVVCSQNNELTAREVFENHPEMVLRLEDISCFVANWIDKPTNLRTIAQRLNIGLDSLVFLDDNPAERAIVRRLLPEVAVPEVSGDPLDFITVLERHRYFQVVSLAAADFQRTDYYRQNAVRDELRTRTRDLDEFLQSLDMSAKIAPIQPMTFERATQLINKSNQFNLTTRRRSAGEVMAIVSDPNWLTLTVSLTDRFGDNGLISVVFGYIDGDNLEIDTWLMSCRVLKRGVENALLNYLCAAARTRGVKYIRGEYIPAPKNELVREHYAKLGFRNIRTEPDGHSSWELAVADFKPLRHFIKEAEVDGFNS